VFIIYYYAVSGVVVEEFVDRETGRGKRRERPAHSVVKK
jgi:hypothetical protein